MVDGEKMDMRDGDEEQNQKSRAESFCRERIMPAPMTTSV